MVFSDSDTLKKSNSVINERDNIYELNSAGFKGIQTEKLVSLASNVSFCFASSLIVFDNKLLSVVVLLTKSLLVVSVIDSFKEDGVPSSVSSSY